jgi:hypothetical protein
MGDLKSHASAPLLEIKNILEKEGLCGCIVPVKCTKNRMGEIECVNPFLFAERVKREMIEWVWYK